VRDSHSKFIPLANTAGFSIVAKPAAPPPGEIIPPPAANPLGILFIMACMGRTYDPKLGVEAVMLGRLPPPLFVPEPEVAAAGAGVALGLGTPDHGSTSGMYEAVEEASGSKSDEVNVDWNAVGRFRGALLGVMIESDHIHKSVCRSKIALYDLDGLCLTHNMMDRDRYRCASLIDAEAVKRCGQCRLPGSVSYSTDHRYHRSLDSQRDASLIWSDLSGKRRHRSRSHLGMMHDARMHDLMIACTMRVVRSP
jgi:hypothetical protein